METKRKGVAVLVSDKMDFKLKMVKKDKLGYYIMKKGPIHQEGKTIVNTYAPNIRDSKYIIK